MGLSFGPHNGSRNIAMSANGDLASWIVSMHASVGFALQSIVKLEEKADDATNTTSRPTRVEVLPVF